MHYGEFTARVMTLAIQQAESESSSDLKEFIHDEFRRELDVLTKTFVSKVEFESRLAALETRLVRWMFAFWVGQMAVFAGLLLEVLKLTK